MGPVCHMLSTATSSKEGLPSPSHHPVIQRIDRDTTDVIHRRDSINIGDSQDVHDHDVGRMHRLITVEHASHGLEGRAARRPQVLDPGRRVDERHALVRLGRTSSRSASPPRALQRERLDARQRLAGEAPQRARSTAARFEERP